MSWDYKTPTTPPPAPNNFRLNASGWAASSELYIARRNKANVDMLVSLTALKVGDLVYVQLEADAANRASYRVTAAPVAGGTTPADGFVTLKVQHVESHGAPVANNTHLVEFTPELVTPEPPEPPEPGESQSYYPTFDSLTAGHTYRFVTVYGHEFVGVYHETYADGCLCIYRGELEAYVNPMGISHVWETTPDQEPPYYPKPAAELQ